MTMPHRSTYGFAFRYWFGCMKLRTYFLVVPSLFAALALSGCSTTGGKGGGGSLLPPSKPPASATFITALDGGIVGRTGLKLSDNDKQRALEAEYRALETAPLGQPVAWKGRNASGEVVAAAPYQVGSQNCRQYTHTITVDSKPTTARGAACRNDDGTWTLLE
ncbi:Surface antigen [Rhizobium miluonense]|uniref:Surface antigen n=2 Tax=Rhizobium/Agrobacterium group TaxID=227290 RepID=A0A1C3UV83_9HYPH|nr:Surface antigen [Rhizobium miluonense]